MGNGFILANLPETGLNWRIEYLAICHRIGRKYDVALAHAQWTKNWRCLIWRLTPQLPNRQIKTTAKISRYTVVCPKFRGAQFSRIDSSKYKGFFRGAQIE